MAAENFFQEENLTALREIALRFTAEKVDHDLHGMLHGKGWRTRERLMVAISPSPDSEQLIRAARRLAFELDAPWIAVHVDTGVQLNDQDQARLNRHFNLARELGADVIATHDLDIAAALQSIARQKDITRIVIGRSPKRKFNIWTIFQGSLVDRLENDNKHIDIVILRQGATDQYLPESSVHLPDAKPLESLWLGDDGCHCPHRDWFCHHSTDRLQVCWLYLFVRNSDLELFCWERPYLFCCCSKCHLLGLAFHSTFTHPHHF